MNRRILREKRTVLQLIRIYCRTCHNSEIGLCKSCNSLKTYAERQTDNCRFGDRKPVCSKCPVHCYNKDKRKMIKEVMQHAGPKMIYQHPVLAIMHLHDKVKFKPKYKL